MQVVAAAKQHSRHSNKLWRYGTHSSFTLHSGSGNNWAWGFCENGPKSEEAVMNLIRREVYLISRFSWSLFVFNLQSIIFLLLLCFLRRNFLQVEKCDTFAGFVSIQSLAGGTGGGVGQLKKHLLLRSHVSVPTYVQYKYPYRDNLETLCTIMGRCLYVRGSKRWVSIFLYIELLYMAIRWRD